MATVETGRILFMRAFRAAGFEGALIDTGTLRERLAGLEHETRLVRRAARHPFRFRFLGALLLPLVLGCIRLLPLVERVSSVVQEPVVRDRPQRDIWIVYTADTTERGSLARAAASAVAK